MHDVVSIAGEELSERRGDRGSWVNGVSSGRSSLTAGGRVQCAHNGSSRLHCLGGGSVLSLATARGPRLVGGVACGGLSVWAHRSKME